MTIQVNPDQYYNGNYDHKDRFISYWHQINEIIKQNPKTILEIGIGNGFVSKYLRERNLNVTTLDIDKRLNPDVTGDILNIPFKDGSFDVVVCYEVLEHLEYKKFSKAVSELSRVSNAYVIISLPQADIVYKFSFQIPLIGYIKLLIPRPKFRRPVHKFDGEHYWEIGKKDYPIKIIIKDLQRAGFYVEKTYRVFENPYHRFFVLK